jgi:hypothetical protein
MDKNSLPAANKDDIGFTWQPGAMQAKPITHCIKKPTNEQFRGCVFRTDPRHKGATALWRTVVRHTAPFCKYYPFSTSERSAGLEGYRKRQP